MIPIQKLSKSLNKRQDTKDIKDQKSNIKLCKDCIFLQKDTLVCRKFVNMSLVTGEEFPILAIHARDNDSFCGYGAFHFERILPTNVQTPSRHPDSNEYM